MGSKEDFNHYHLGDHQNDIFIDEWPHSADEKGNLGDFHPSFPSPRSSEATEIFLCPCKAAPHIIEKSYFWVTT